MGGQNKLNIQRLKEAKERFPRNTAPPKVVKIPSKASKANTAVITVATIFIES